MIITISDMWKNQQKMLDNDNQIKLSSLIGFLAVRDGQGGPSMTGNSWPHSSLSPLGQGRHAAFSSMKKIPHTALSSWNLRHPKGVGGESTPSKDQSGVIRTSPSPSLVTPSKKSW